MTIEEVSDILSESEFSPEVSAEISSILSAAKARGNITEEEKAKLLGLIDLEIDSANIEADAMEEMAAALDDFAKEADDAAEQLQKDLQDLDAQLTTAAA